MDNERIPQDKAELMDQIEREWKTLFRATDKLAPEQMTAPGVGRWSPKDNLAHLAVWEQFMLRCCLQGEPPHQALQIDKASLERLDQDGVNQILFERNRLRSMEDILEELRQSHAQTLAVLELMTFANLMQPNPDDPQGRPLIIWVMGNTYQHYRKHRQVIQSVLED